MIMAGGDFEGGAVDNITKSIFGGDEEESSIHTADL